MTAGTAREATTDFAIGQFGAETYALIGIVCLLASVLIGMGGFGTGLIISIFVAPLVGVQALVPVMSVAMLLNNIGRVWAYFPALDRRIFLVMMLSAIPASVLGAIVYVQLDTALISGVLGAVLIASVPLSRYLARQQLRVGPATLAAVGGIFGFVSSIVLGAGLLVISILLGLGLVGPALLATDAAIAVGTSLARMVMFRHARRAHHRLVPRRLADGTLHHTRRLGRRLDHTAHRPAAAPLRRRSIDRRWRAVLLVARIGEIAAAARDDGWCEYTVGAAALRWERRPTRSSRSAVRDQPRRTELRQQRIWKFAMCRVQWRVVSSNQVSLFVVS